MMLSGNRPGRRRFVGVCSLRSLGALGCANASHSGNGATPSTSGRSGNGAPRTILLRGDRLAESRPLFASGEPALKPTFDAVMASARTALAAEPLSVMQKGRIPLSGDKHDYMSMAPYWWPDTTKPNGLPFVRRDWKIYPASRDDHDGVRLELMRTRVIFACSFSTPPRG